MYLKLYESIGHVGEVRVDPYEYEYTGDLDAVEEYLWSGPHLWATSGEVPTKEEQDPVSPEVEEMADTRSILNAYKRALLARGLAGAVIIDG